MNEQVKTLKPMPIFEKISKAAIYLFVFLAPLFFLPWTSNVLDFNKQILLFILVFVSLVCWIIKTLREGELKINFSFLNIPVLFLVLITGISIFFSLSRYGSFWGWPLNISSSFTTLAAFVLLFFLISNLFNDRSDISKLISLLILSGFISALLGLLQLFRVFIFPFDFARTESFNTIGTINSLAVFLSVIIVAGVGLMLGSVKIMRKLLLAFCVFGFLVLFVINFTIAWMVLLIGLAGLLSLALFNIKKAKETSWFLLPMTMMILSIFFIFFKISLPFLPSTPFEVYPNNRAELEIAKSVLQGKNLILGTGPGTFIYDYSKFKSGDINKTLFWNVRFGSGSSEVLDRLITTGFLGALVFASLFSFFLWQVFYSLKKGLSEEISDWFIASGIFASIFALFVGLFLYAANFVILMIFWVLLGIFVTLLKPRNRSWKLQPSSMLTVIIHFISILVIISGLVFNVFVVQKYIAETKYLKGLEAFSRGEIDKSIDFTAQSLKLNPDSDLYLRELAQNYLQKLNLELQRTDVSKEELSQTVQTLGANAVSFAKKSTEIEPENVANWNVLGFIYRNLIGIFDKADELSLGAYEKGLQLEPNNPYVFTEIGRVYLTKSVILANQTEGNAEKEVVLKKAQESFEKAIELKSDYAPAKFQLALTYVSMGKIKEAIAKMEETILIAPSDVNLVFQLGLLYFNGDQFENAKLALERAISLAIESNQEYANARYYLGLTYDKLNQKEKAIEQFEKIQTANPDNEEIKKIIFNLKSGKPALEGITAQSESVIEESQPESPSNE